MVKCQNIKAKSPNVRFPDQHTQTAPGACPCTSAQSPSRAESLFHKIDTVHARECGVRTTLAPLNTDSAVVRSPGCRSDSPGLSTSSQVYKLFPA